MGNNSHSNTTGRMLERHLDGSLIYDRVVGDDGHYYVCEECRDGGDLLCCDSCPRTYHLQCLNPPLEVVPEGDWHCRLCVKEKGVRRRRRSKRVKRNALEKPIIPEFTHPTKNKNTSLVSDDSPDDEPKSSSAAHKPLLVRIKWESRTLRLGHIERSKEKKRFVGFDSSNCSGNKSKGEEKRDSDMELNSSHKPILVRLKRKPKEKSEENNKTVDNNNHIMNREILAEIAPSSAEGLEVKGLIGSEALTDVILQVPNPPVISSAINHQSAPHMSTKPMPNKPSFPNYSFNQNSTMPESNTKKALRERLNINGKKNSDEPAIL